MIRILFLILIPTFCAHGADQQPSFGGILTRTLEQAKPIDPTEFANEIRIFFAEALGPDLDPFYKNLALRLTERAKTSKTLNPSEAKEQIDAAVAKLKELEAQREVTAAKLAFLRDKPADLVYRDAQATQISQKEIQLASLNERIREAAETALLIPFLARLRLPGSEAHSDLRYNAGHLLTETFLAFLLALPTALYGVRDGITTTAGIWEVGYATFLAAMGTFAAVAGISNLSEIQSDKQNHRAFAKAKLDLLILVQQNCEATLTGPRLATDDSSAKAEAANEEEELQTAAFSKRKSL